VGFVRAPRAIAIIGAECTGKSTLAAALAANLGAITVPEALRLFVDSHGRPPFESEQAGVLAAQVAAESAACTAAPGGWVISDSGALMTAVYSIVYFGDGALVEPAAQHHRTSYLLTVWCDIDLPWLAEPGHRDGPAFRQRGHEVIAELLGSQRLSVLPVRGSVAARVASVLAALPGVGTATV
jgi:nicotinamide riboside kinase